MADKIKVLQIKRNEINDDNANKKSFNPVEDFWYDNSDSISISLDFDKTIALKKKKAEPKISLVQNANSHFLKKNKSNSIYFNKNDIEDRTFESLNILDRSINSRPSNLPNEILKLRELSYQKEQLQKEELLEKLNVNLNQESIDKNYNLTSREYDKYENKELNKNQSLENHLNNEELYLPRSKSNDSTFANKHIHRNKNETKGFSRIEDKETLEREAMGVFEEARKLKEAEVQMIEAIRHQQEIINKQKELLNKNQELLQRQEKKEQIQRQKEALLRKKEELLEQQRLRDFEEKRRKQAMLEQKHNQDIELKKQRLLEKQLRKESFKKALRDKATTTEIDQFFDIVNDKKKSMTMDLVNSFLALKKGLPKPVVNNLDYDNSFSTDDFNKAVESQVTNPNKEKQKQEFFDQTGETTQLVNKLVVDAQNINKATFDKPNFDDFEEWFESVKNNNKLSRKERKKLAKGIKGK